MLYQLRLWEVQRTYGRWAPEVQECVVLLRLIGWPMVKAAPWELQPAEIANAYFRGEIRRLSTEAALLRAEGKALHKRRPARPSQEDLVLLLQSRVPEVRQLAIRLVASAR
jgi:hypothetical protein